MLQLKEKYVHDSRSIQYGSIDVNASQDFDKLKLKIQVYILIIIEINM